MTLPCKWAKVTTRPSADRPDHDRWPPRLKRSTPLAALAVAAMLAVVPACSSSSSKPKAATGTPITIGAILDLTGPTAASDAYQLQGIKLAMSQINAAGGVHGHPLQLSSADDGANPANDGPAYQRLVEQGHAVALLGPTLSGDVQAVLQEQQRSGVYVPVVGIGGDPSLFEGSNAKWYFGASQQVALFAQQEVQALVKHANVSNKVFGVIYSDIAAAKSAADDAKAEVLKEHQSFAAEPAVGLTQTDMLPQLQQMKSAGVNLVVGDLLTSPPTILGFLHGISQLSWNVQWFLPDIGLSQLYGTVPNSLLEGGIVGNICDSRTSQFQQMLAAYNTMFGKAAPAGSYDSLGAMYNGARTLFTAMNRASNTQPNQVLNALNSTKDQANYCGGTPVNLSPSKHYLNDTYTFAHIVNGSKVYY